mgnify:CR=1 FL=1|jgi:hypothetical protein
MDTLTLRDRLVFVVLAAGTVGLSMASSSTLAF